MLLLRHTSLDPSAFRHPDYLAIWVEVSRGVELQDKLIIPLCELLSHKLIDSTSLETIMYTWIVILILLDVVPVDPSHVTHYGLLVKKNGLIEVLLFLCMDM